MHRTAVFPHMFAGCAERAACIEFDGWHNPAVCAVILDRTQSRRVESNLDVRPAPGSGQIRRLERLTTRGAEEGDAQRTAPGARQASTNWSSGNRSRSSTTPKVIIHSGSR